MEEKGTIIQDIQNRKKLWDFQEISHDIWNLDIPAPPILTSININSIKIDVVVAVTKSGNTIILDRLTGEPIFDFHKKKAPRSKIAGEKTAYYQPNLKIPEPFSKQIFGNNEITNISNISKNYIQNKIKIANYGFFQPDEILFCPPDSFWVPRYIILRNMINFCRSGARPAENNILTAGN